MIERRKGGETGVAAVQLIEGEAVWKAGEKRRLVTHAFRSSALTKRHTVWFN